VANGLFGPVGKESRLFVEVGDKIWTLNRMVEEINTWIAAVHS
jgi:hypothetical protein